MLAGKPIPVYGDGSTRRDYTYIDDIIAGVLRAVDYVSAACRYDIFNLGESQTISLQEMIAALEEALQIEAEKTILPLQPGDVQQTFADISKSRKILDYDPRTSFQKGITLFIDWLRKQ